MRSPRNMQGSYSANDFWAQFSSETPRMAMFVKITPRLDTDLSAIGITSNTRNMTLPGHSGITFKSAAGLSPSELQNALDSASNLEMFGMYEDGLFVRSDVINGKWDDATVEIFLASWANVDLGELVIFKGNLADFKDYQTHFKAEARGLIAKLSQDVAKVISRACRVKEFQSADCGFTGSTVTISGQVYDINNAGVGLYTSGPPQTKSLIYIDEQYWTGQFIPKAVPPNNYFQNGVITCESGLNIGLSREISANTSHGTLPQMKIVLKRAFPFAIANTDQFTLKAGCKRTIEDCKKFGNAINFKGEPFVPSLTTLSHVPSTDE